MTLDGDVLTLTEADVDHWDSSCGRIVAAVVVPNSRRATFFQSAAYLAVMPMVRRGVFVFVGTERQVDVVPAANRRVSLSATSGAVVYLRIAHDDDTVAERVVEVIPGRVVVDVCRDNVVLGVELFL